MKNYKIVLCIASLVLMGLAIVDIVQLCIGYANGSFDWKAVAVEQNVSESIAKVTVIGVMVFGGVISVIKLITGLLGLKQAVGKRSGSFHIVIAWIMLIFGLISLIMSVMTVVKTPSSWTGLLTTAATFAITVLFLYSAKQLKSEE